MLIDAEHKRRPELTHIIAGSSGGMKADDVAEKALKGIKSGTFIIPCNFEGIMLSIATAGLSPQRSYLIAFVEVLGAGFMRLLGISFQWNWFNTIENWHAKKGSKYIIYIKQILKQACSFCFSINKA